MPDPRLNCAADICCSPPNAHAARVSILRDMGVPEHCAEACATKMVEMGVAFTSTELAAAISAIVDHPNLKKKP